MFGSKKAKQARLKKIAGLVETQPHTLTEKELARALRVARTTISKDLAALEENGVLLAEADRARLSLFRRIFGK